MRCPIPLEFDSFHKADGRVAHIHTKRLHNLLIKLGVFNLMYEGKTTAGWNVKYDLR